MPETVQKSTYDFSGRVAIVTGAGSGIGRAMALGFAKAGAAVLVNDFAADRAHETVAMIEAQGGKAAPAVADISNEMAVTAFVDGAVERWGRIDILCNNAGIMDKVNLPVDTSTDMWNKIIAINLTGCFLVTRAVLPHMIAQKKGSIINTASAAGMRGGCAGLAYVASKHGVVGITRNVAYMHGPEGIRCNAICPGAVETNITGEGGLASLDQAGIARATPVMALGTLGQPINIAEAAFFLASDASSFINGAIIPVDGGWSAA